MNPADLAELLRSCTAGADRAAVDLLAAQGHWMREMAERPDEMAVIVDHDDEAWWADVDWTVLGDRLTRGELVGSTGEYTVLRVACSLAGYPTPLNDLHTLDAANIRLVLAAVAQAANRTEVFPA